LDEPTASILAITGAAGPPPHPWSKTTELNINANMKILINIKVSFKNNIDNEMNKYYFNHNPYQF
jgi:hypothetical protein